MGNVIFIQEKRVCAKPIHSRLEAIQKLKPPTTVKGCRSFVGMVNFLGIFCQDIQKLLKPIYDLTDNKGRFHLYSDTSKDTTGSALYQIQNGKPNLIAYANKRMPEATKIYSITELEMC